MQCFYSDVTLKHFTHYCSFVWATGLHVDFPHRQPAMKSVSFVVNLKRFGDQKSSCQWFGTSWCPCYINVVCFVCDNTSLWIFTYTNQQNATKRKPRAYFWRYTSWLSIKEDFEMQLIIWKRFILIYKWSFSYITSTSVLTELQNCVLCKLCSCKTLMWNSISKILILRIPNVCKIHMNVASISIYTLIFYWNSFDNESWKQSKPWLIVINEDKAFNNRCVIRVNILYIYI